MKHHLETFLNLKLAISVTPSPNQKPQRFILGELHGLDVTYDLFDPLSNTEDGFVIQINDLRDAGAAVAM